MPKLILDFLVNQLYFCFLMINCEGFLAAILNESMLIKNALRRCDSIAAATHIHHVTKREV